MRITFVSNYAGRTGAPMVLLEFQRWLAEHRAARFSTFFGAGGALWDDFARLGPVRHSPFFPGAPLPLHLALLRRLLGPTAWTRHACRSPVYTRPALESEIILANTAVTAREVEWLAGLGRPVVWHLHELRQVIDSSIGIPAFRRTLGLCRRVVVVSSQTLAFLRDELAFPADRLDLVPEFIRVRDWTGEQRNRVRSEFRQRHGLPPDGFVVGGCGTLGWRKGSDLFVQAAGHIRRRHPNLPATFVWMGGGDDVVRRRLEHDVMAAGLEGCCRFLGELPDASTLMPALDLLAVTSREDPFPLIMMEAAAAGVPMVGFEGSGGPAEFAGAGAGRVVPYLDALAFSEVIAQLACDEPSRRRLAAGGAGLVRRDHDVAVQGPRLLDILERARGPL